MNIDKNKISHHGIKGMHWGIRRYQNPDGTLTPAGKRRYFNSDGTLTKAGMKEYNVSDYRKDAEAHKKRRKIIAAAAAIGLGLGFVTVSAVNHYKNLSKKYVDQVLKKGSSINTLIKDPGRVKKPEYLFESHKFLDRNQYRSRFGKWYERDEQTGKVLTSHFKLDAKHILNKDMRIASEQSAADSFVSMYRKDKGFRKYIDNAYKEGGMDMKPLIEVRRLAFPEFRKANNILKNKSGRFSDDDLRSVYKIFNFNLVNNNKNDVKFRKKFFKELKKRGYSGLIDTNDTLYGGYHTRASNIIFDTKGLTLKSLEKLNDKDVARAAIIDGATFLNNPYWSQKFFGGTALGISGVGIANEVYYKKKKKKQQNK